MTKNEAIDEKFVNLEEGLRGQVGEILKSLLLETHQDFILLIEI